MSVKKIINILIFIVFILTFYYIQQLTCKKKNVKILSGTTMGTYWKVKIPNLKNTKHIKNVIKNILSQDENMISSWKKESIVSQFNRCKKNTLQKINKKFFDVIAYTLFIHKKTQGKLDITIEPLVNIWGFSTKKKLINTLLKKQLQNKFLL